MKSSKTKKVYTFTKVFVIVITIASIVWVTWSYILATYAAINLGVFNPLQTLSKYVCTTIIATVFTYCTKAFFETFCSEKNKTKIKINNCSNDDYLDDNEEDNTFSSSDISSDNYTDCAE